MTTGTSHPRRASLFVLYPTPDALVELIVRHRLRLRIALLRVGARHLPQRQHLIDARQQQSPGITIYATVEEFGGCVAKRHDIARQTWY